MIYKILKILDKYRVVVNIPANSGVNKGEIFVIYSQGEEVKDPQTNELMGHVDNVKASLKVIHVQDNFCIMESNETETYTEESPLFSSISTAARLFGPRVRKVLKPLEIDDKEAKIKNDSDKTIRVGDLVKKDKSG